MIEQNDIDLLESLRFSLSKKNSKTITDVYTRYTGIAIPGCFCSEKERERTFLFVYGWLDSQLNENKEI